MKNQRLSRRDFLRTSAGLATMAALSACVAPGAPATGEGGQAAPNAEGATISYWTFWADRWGEFQQKIVDDYNANGKDGI